MAHRVNPSDQVVLTLKQQIPDLVTQLGKDRTGTVIKCINLGLRAALAEIPQDNAAHLRTKQLEHDVEAMNKFNQVLDSRNVALVRKHVALLQLSEDQVPEQCIKRAIAFGLTSSAEIAILGGMNNPTERRLLLMRSQLLDLHIGWPSEHTHIIEPFLSVSATISSKRGDGWTCDCCMAWFNGALGRSICSKGCDVDFCQDCVQLDSQMSSEV
jgi:hypothetical protein